MQKKALITGATGFVGSWLTKRLIKDGYDVIAPVRNIKKAQELNSEGATLEPYSLTDSKSINSIFKKHQPDIVFHLAGYIAYKKEERQKMYEANVTGTQNIVSACTKYKTSKLIYMSSVVAIGAGQNKNDVLDEMSPFNVGQYDFGYFETKKEAESIVMAAHKKEGLHAICLNPSTIYGPGDMLKGSRKAQLKAAKGKMPFYPKGGVSIIHIEDLISAVMASITKAKPGERYILSGENISLKELFSIISKAAKVQPPKIGLNRPVMLTIAYLFKGLGILGIKAPLSVENAYIASMYHWFDNTKATNTLGLVTRPAEEIIKESVLWAKEHSLI